MDVDIRPRVRAIGGLYKNSPPDCRKRQEKGVLQSRQTCKPILCSFCPAIRPDGGNGEQSKRSALEAVYPEAYIKFLRL